MTKVHKHRYTYITTSYGEDFETAYGVCSCGAARLTTTDYTTGKKKKVEFFKKNEYPKD